MVDFHSHVLPAIDDGSRNVEESIALLKELAKQGVKTVVATPHFYANRHSVNRFLEKRQQAYEELITENKEDLPKILLGAEVRYYEGISQMANIESLCIEGTKLLLLEMPFSRWTDYVLREVLHLASSGKVTVIIAHVERYLPYQEWGVWGLLTDNGAILQANANFFLKFTTRKKAIKLLKERYIKILGSDCHNLDERPPLIGNAIAYIEKKAGQECYESLIARSRKLIGITANHNNERG